MAKSAKITKSDNPDNNSKPLIYRRVGISMLCSVALTIIVTFLLRGLFVNDNPTCLKDKLMFDIIWDSGYIAFKVGVYFRIIFTLLITFFSGIFVGWLYIDKKPFKIVLLTLLLSVSLILLLNSIYSKHPGFLDNLFCGPLYFIF